MVAWPMPRCRSISCFCQITGFGGTTQVAGDAPKGFITREMTVRFDSNVANDLAWTVTPAAHITDNIGKVDTVNYVATNNSDRPITGMAVFNVSPPEKAASISQDRVLLLHRADAAEPGQTVDMPIVFFVDPELDDNQELDTIKEITLSYTFYASDNEGS